MSYQEEPTHLVPIDRLCGNRENREHLDYYLYNYIPHFGGRLHVDVSFETQKEAFHALEDINDSAVTCLNIPDRLRRGHKIVSAKERRKRIHTERRTPTPTKIAFAGEKTYQINKYE